MVSDISERYFILAGMAAFILLIPVTITSTDKMMRRLGKNWRRVHRLVYVIAILSLLHFWLLTKRGVFDPYPATGGVFLLLAWRIRFAWKKSNYKIPDDGMETPPHK
jgi:sulfoxide reductase heme-binding subunit YedZ